MSEQPHNESTGEHQEQPLVPETNTGLQYLLRTLHVLFVGLRVLIVVVIIWVLLGGIFYVKEDEKAMLFRFGKLVSKDGQKVLSSEKGRLYWAWPYPIDEVVKVKTEQPVTVTTEHFWPQEKPEAATAGGSNKGALQVGQDGYVLTGDANIVHMVWSATYQISDLKQYYLGFKGAKSRVKRQAGPGQSTEGAGVKAVVEDVLGNAVIKEVGRWPVKDVILTSQGGQGSPEALAGAVERRVKRQLADIDAGVEIQSISLREWRPPAAVDDAFSEINRAAQANQRLLDQAGQYKEEKLAAAKARKSEILAEARAYKTRTLESVKAEADYFQDILEKYNKRPQTTLIALYTDTLRRVLQQTESEYVIHTRQTGEQEVRLRLGPPAARQKESE